MTLGNEIVAKSFKWAPRDATRAGRSGLACLQAHIQRFSPGAASSIRRRRRIMKQPPFGAHIFIPPLCLVVQMCSLAHLCLCCYVLSSACALCIALRSVRPNRSSRFSYVCMRVFCFVATGCGLLPQACGLSRCASRLLPSCALRGLLLQSCAPYPPSPIAPSLAAQPHESVPGIPPAALRSLAEKML